MNIKQIENILVNGGIEKNEAKIEAKMLLKHFLGLSDIDLALKDEFEEHEAVLKSAYLRVEKRIPIQHILGQAYFMGEMFKVDGSVLIPRDETEILVRKAIEIIKNNDIQRVLDIGTGSGCIACMIAKIAKVQVVGLDISKDALQTALDNASSMNLFNRAIFRKSDVYSNVKEGETFDLIVSNPPYIPVSMKESIDAEVKFDPELALFAQDEDGIEFYERIIKDAHTCLNKNGFIVFEIGINQANAVKKIFQKYGFSDIEILNDLAGIERVISAKFFG